MMENNNSNGQFVYSYSAKEQTEIKNIRKKYTKTEASKLEELRALDRSVTQKGNAVSLIVGVIGALVLGIGMCCCMVWADTLFIPGVIIGVAGIALVALAYPVYTLITRREREKIAPEIIRLTDELLK